MLKRKAQIVQDVEDFKGIWLDMDFNYGKKSKTTTTNSSWFRITEVIKTKTMDIKG